MVFLPSYLLVAGALPFWARLRADARMRRALAGVNAPELRDRDPAVRQAAEEARQAMAAQLPPGTKVINEPTSFYRVNRSRIILAAAVFTVLCGVIVALSINLLRRRRAERALRLAEDQLRSAQKMEAIGLLAGGVAHDFNNILQVIEGHTAFLLESGNIGPQDREDVEMIRTAAQRAAQLTRQLLVFSR